MTLLTCVDVPVAEYPSSLPIQDLQIHIHELQYKTGLPCKRYQCWPNMLHLCPLFPLHAVSVTTHDQHIVINDLIDKCWSQGTYPETSNVNTNNNWIPFILFPMYETSDGASLSPETVPHHHGGSRQRSRSSLCVCVCSCACACMHACMRVCVCVCVCVSHPHQPQPPWVDVSYS